MTVAFFYFGAGGLLFTLVGAIARVVAPTRHMAGRRAVGLAFRSFLRLLRVFGLAECEFEALDMLRGQGRLIIAPNHPTLLDAVLVIARIPEVACILKAPLLENPFLGGGARWAGHIRNDRGSGMIREAVVELSAGGQLLVFPEGTRTAPGATLNSFKGGFALIARESGAPVQVIIIEADPPFLSKDRAWWQIPDFPLRFRVRLGRRFDPPAPGSDVRTWVRHLERRFHEELR